MRHPHGLFGWVDLATADVEAARAFYGDLFGWSTLDIPMGPDYTYTQFLLDGQRVAGMGPLTPDMAAAGLPSAWSSYVLVDDAEAVTAAAAAAGGTVLAPVMEIPGQGRMATFADPSGAVVGVWEPGGHEGAEVFNVPGSLTWNELQSRDLDAAAPFYARVFGWRWAPMDDGSGYLVGHLDTKPGDDTSNCGAMAMPPGVPDEVPSLWMVYFAVADTQASFDRALELGASVMFEPMAMGPGTFAGIVDPTGAGFSLGAFG